MNEDELREMAGDVFADEFLMIESTGNRDIEGNLYIERGTIEGGVIRFDDSTTVPTGYGFPLRDIFPARPAERGSISYLTPESFGPGASMPRVTWRDRLHAWWRKHWWPARIRDLEAELRDANRDLWGDE